MIQKANRIPDIVYHPQFLKFIEYYTKIFIRNRGYGIWLKEYQDMQKKGQFAPRVIRLFYIQMLGKNCSLDFQKRQAIWHICCYALDAAKSYVDERENALYDIVVITGEQAYDDDDDPYTDLTYDEANQIVKALNEEAEEELFTIKRKM